MAYPYTPPSQSSTRPHRGRRLVLAEANSEAASSSRYSTPPTTNKVLSAAEVARSVKHFEIWAAHQACEQVALSDLPCELRFDVGEVFKLTEQIPRSWIDEDGTHAIQIKALSPLLLEFLRKAYDVCPELFSYEAKYSVEDSHELFEELVAVRLAWKRLQTMRQSGLKWSEADYAANVYNMFRSPTIHRSTYRNQCSISLPEPPDLPNGDAQRILHPKNIIPDCATFIKQSSIRQLSSSLQSPYKQLNAHPAIAQLSRIRLEHAFRFQASPCTQPPDTPSFEFVSSTWEDKKPAHELLEHAYRQNRMSTSAALRMLHSLRINTCVFGLIWAEGTVRAHIDWCGDVQGRPTIFSAPYPKNDEDDGPLFHEWKIEKPSDLLQVYFLLRNIDIWTAGEFRGKVVEGVQTFTQNVLAGEEEYSPWKRLNDVRLPTVTEGHENEENVPVNAARSRTRRVRRQ